MNPLHALIIFSLIFGGIAVWSWLRTAGSADQSLYSQAIAAATAAQNATQYIPPTPTYADSTPTYANNSPQEVIPQ